MKGIKNFDRIGNILDKGTSLALKKIGAFVKGEAQKRFKALPGVQVRTSKRTGNRYYHFPGKVPDPGFPHIRSGLTRFTIFTFPAEPKEFVIIASNQKHSISLETGTSRMRARPFLGPAALDNKQQIKNIFNAVMKGKIKVAIK